VGAPFSALINEDSPVFEASFVCAVHFQNLEMRPPTQGISVLNPRAGIASAVGSDPIIFENVEIVSDCQLSITAFFGTYAGDPFGSSLPCNLMMAEVWERKN